MLALTLFLIICGNTVSSIALILILWGFILAIGMGSTYWKHKRQMQVLLTMADQLSERYLISEIMELPEQAEDQVYYQLIKMAGKSMLEQIGSVRRERIEYKEYIEQWIHEIKTPITAMKLLCENHRSEFTKEFLTELEKTNHYLHKIKILALHPALNCYFFSLFWQYLPNKNVVFIGIQPKSRQF